MAQTHVKQMPGNKKSSTPGPATKIISRMYENRVALSEDVKTKVVEVMQDKLAAASDMYSQSKFAHWNVKGDNFYQLHLLFDHIAKVIGKQADPIAERITQLGGVANSLGCYCSELREASDKIDELGDEPTSDFFKQLTVDAEEQLYFLESHLEAGDVQ